MSDPAADPQVVLPQCPICTGPFDEYELVAAENEVREAVTAEAAAQARRAAEAGCVLVAAVAAGDEAAAASAAQRAVAGLTSMLLAVPRMAQLDLSGGDGEDDGKLATLSPRLGSDGVEELATAALAAATAASKDIVNRIKARYAAAAAVGIASSTAPRPEAVVPLDDDVLKVAVTGAARAAVVATTPGDRQLMPEDVQAALDRAGLAPLAQAAAREAREACASALQATATWLDGLDAAPPLPRPAPPLPSAPPAEDAPASEAGSTEPEAEAAAEDGAKPAVEAAPLADARAAASEQELNATLHHRLKDWVAARCSAAGARVIKESPMQLAVAWLQHARASCLQDAIERLGSDVSPGNGTFGPSFSFVAHKRGRSWFPGLRWLRTQRKFVVHTGGDGYLLMLCNMKEGGSCDCGCFTSAVVQPITAHHAAPQPSGDAAADEAAAFEHAVCCGAAAEGALLLPYALDQRRAILLDCAPTAEPDPSAFFTIQRREDTGEAAQLVVNGTAAGAERKYDGCRGWLHGRAPSAVTLRFPASVGGTVALEYAAGALACLARCLALFATLKLPTLIMRPEHAAALLREDARVRAAATGLWHTSGDPRVRAWNDDRAEDARSMLYAKALDMASDVAVQIRMKRFDQEADADARERSGEVLATRCLLQFSSIYVPVKIPRDEADIIKRDALRCMQVELQSLCKVCRMQGSLAAAAAAEARKVCRRWAVAARDNLTALSDAATAGTLDLAALVAAPGPAAERAGKLEALWPSAVASLRATLRSSPELGGIEPRAAHAALALLQRKAARKLARCAVMHNVACVLDNETARTCAIAASLAGSDVCSPSARSASLSSVHASARSAVSAAVSSDGGTPLPPSLDGDGAFSAVRVKVLRTAALTRLSAAVDAAVEAAQGRLDAARTRDRVVAAELSARVRALAEASVGAPPHDARSAHDPAADVAAALLAVTGPAGGAGGNTLEAVTSRARALSAALPRAPPAGALTDDVPAYVAGKERAAWRRRAAALVAAGMRAAAARRDVESALVAARESLLAALHALHADTSPPDERDTRSRSTRKSAHQELAACVRAALARRFRDFLGDGGGRTVGEELGRCNDADDGEDDSSAAASARPPASIVDALADATLARLSAAIVTAERELAAVLSSQRAANEAALQAALRELDSWATAAECIVTGPRLSTADAADALHSDTACGASVRTTLVSRVSAGASNAYTRADLSAHAAARFQAVNTTLNEYVAARRRWDSLARETEARMGGDVASAMEFRSPVRERRAELESARERYLRQLQASLPRCAGSSPELCAVLLDAASDAVRRVGRDGDTVLASQEAVYQSAVGEAQMVLRGPVGSLYRVSSSPTSSFARESLERAHGARRQARADHERYCFTQGANFAAEYFISTTWAEGERNSEWRSAEIEAEAAVNAIKAREEAEQRVREEAERRTHEEAERHAREDAERRAREEGERRERAREEAERRERYAAEDRERAAARDSRDAIMMGAMLVAASAGAGPRSMYTSTPNLARGQLLCVGESFYHPTHGNVTIVRVDPSSDTPYVVRTQGWKQELIWLRAENVAIPS